MHHTGIKTEMKLEIDYPDADYFNCTIQELKPQNPAICFFCHGDFNCTIQELKHEI